MQSKKARNIKKIAAAVGQDKNPAYLAKVETAGSSPVYRSPKTSINSGFRDIPGPLFFFARKNLDRKIRQKS